MAIRGPKKKKGASKVDAPDSSDIVNIFKDRPDPAIHPIEMYPPWLMRLLDEQYSPDDVMMQIYRGERIPTGHEQWSLVKSLRRQYLNDQNYYKKVELVYESDDDRGEDNGMDEEEFEGGAGAGTEKSDEKKEEKKEEAK